MGNNHEGQWEWGITISGAWLKIWEGETGGQGGVEAYASRAGSQQDTMAQVSCCSFPRNLEPSPNFKARDHDAYYY